MDKASKSKVWVVQENPHLDYSPAEVYGQVHFMTADELRPMATSLNNKRVIADIERGVSQLDAEDWLVLTGNPISMGYAFHLAMRKNGQVKCLQWDRMRGEYKPFTFKREEHEHKCEI